MAAVSAPQEGREEWVVIGPGGKKVPSTKNGGRGNKKSKSRLKESRNGSTQSSRRPLTLAEHTTSVPSTGFLSGVGDGDETRFHFASCARGNNVKGDWGDANSACAAAAATAAGGWKRSKKRRPGRWKATAESDSDNVNEIQSGIPPHRTELNDGIGDNGSSCAQSAHEKEARRLLAEFHRLNAKWAECETAKGVEMVLEKRYGEEVKRLEKRFQSGAATGASDGDGGENDDIETGSVSDSSAVIAPPKIEYAFCIATGSFSRRWQHRMRGMWQLVMFLACIKKITELQSFAPTLYAQEPLFTHPDRLFLNFLGIHVLDWAGAGDAEAVEAKNRTKPRTKTVESESGLETVIEYAIPKSSEALCEHAASIGEIPHHPSPPTESHSKHASNLETDTAPEKRAFSELLLPSPSPPAPASSPSSPLLSSSSAEELYRHNHSKSFLFAPFLQWAVLMPNFMVCWDSSAGSYVSTVPRLYVGTALSQIADSIETFGWVGTEGVQGKTEDEFGALDCEQGGGMGNRDTHSISPANASEQTECANGRPPSEDGCAEPVRISRRAQRRQRKLDAQERGRRTEGPDQDDDFDANDPDSLMDCVEMTSLERVILGRNMGDAACALVKRLETGALWQLMSKACAHVKRQRTNETEVLDADGEDGVQINALGAVDDAVKGSESGAPGARTTQLTVSRTEMCTAPAPALAPPPSPPSASEAEAKRLQKRIRTVTDEVPPFDGDSHALRGLVLMHSW